MIAWVRLDRKPPLIVTNKIKHFICAQCLQPATGSINARVHQGDCRKLWQAKITSRARKLRRKREKAART